MNKKKWLLLLIIIITIAVYLKLFYKTYKLSSVPQSADQIITIDKKKIINTMIWNTVTTPSEWNVKAVFAPAKKDSSWVDIINLPDYVFVFHTTDQPANIFYTVLETGEEKDFSNGLLKYHFIENADQHKYKLYYSAENEIMLLRNGKLVLAATIQPEQIHYALQTAADLFEKKSYQSRDVIEKTIAASSHAACWIKQNNFLQQDAVFKADFTKDQISISGVIAPKNIRFEEETFSSSNNNLAEIGFAKPTGASWSMLFGRLSNKLSDILACNADSVLTGKAAMQLSLAGIQQKNDSAISYNYDDDFNKIEKVVVNVVPEPALQISLKGDSMQRLYSKWKASEKLEATAEGELLVLIPFVKSYITTNTPSALQITSYNFKHDSALTQIKCIAFCNINFQKLTTETRKYLPDAVNASTENIGSANLIINSLNGQASLKISITKRKNNLPLFNF